jgi:hypothetical protein
MDVVTAIWRNNVPYALIRGAISASTRLSPDGNYSTVELAEHLDTNSSYREHSERRQTKEKVKPTIKPKPKSSCINSEENR